MKRLVIDLDDTLCHTVEGDYRNAQPADEVVQKLREYRAMGFEIVLYTSRNMRTHAGNIGKINALTLPTIVEWLDRHAVPYDEIHVGKPWCGHDGFYVDDKAVRPREFLAMSYDQIRELIG